ncbi:MAG TPA: tRNA uridine-5-carboxymethylaminomethyl(34) synthesis GTPase MnmE, partial [Erythrobacter sp.]|nr:tRNA uridine-5-carboxymethylaminomethyl(34) synthesis GTPase MnmE [Erythrobacter sp.]
MADTIYALSSGAPPAGIGVIRISGPRAGEALSRMANGLPPARSPRLRI